MVMFIDVLYQITSHDIWQRGISTDQRALTQSVLIRAVFFSARSFALPDVMGYPTISLFQVYLYGIQT